MAVWAWAAGNFALEHRRADAVKMMIVNVKKPFLFMCNQAADAKKYDACHI